MPAFAGQLRANEIFGTIYNMIISQQVFADNIAGTNSQLVDKAKVDGSLYGDSKLYYATDALSSVPFVMDSAEQLNLLATHRPEDPKCQVIYLDKFRQIPLTVDNYLTKRAWQDEGAFTSFNSVMLGWMGETKKIYDSTLYNTYIGTTTSECAKNKVEVDITGGESGLTGEEKARVEAESIAQAVADLLVEMTDISRDFNDYGFLRSYSQEAIKVVWNTKWLNKITKRDLPTIFHKDGIMDKFEEKLPARYFGKVNTASGTTPASNKTIRSLVEKDYGLKHVFPGDLLPASTAYAANETYTEDGDVIAKVYVKLPPFMSAFEVGTTFFNSKNLSENHYLTWGHNTIEYLKNYPLISIVKKA